MHFLYITAKTGDALVSGIWHLLSSVFSALLHMNYVFYVWFLRFFYFTVTFTLAQVPFCA